MKIFKSVGLVLLSLLSLSAVASSEQENLYLVQLLNQIDAMWPIILAAQKEQPKNTRISFHYTAYQDANGQGHNGLLEDLHLVRKGIEEKLTHSWLEPRVIAPLHGDYMGTRTEAKP